MTSDNAQTDTRKQQLRQIPAISAILAAPKVQQHADGLRPELVTRVVQEVVARFRASILNGDEIDAAQNIVERVAAEFEALRQPKLREVINGTGVIIHTNLGRSPVSEETARAMLDAATHYVPLEIELAAGKRGGRMAEVTRLMAQLTGAEATLVVNNNAAAVLLTLSALAAGREVILSRSQAVEIGGGFRVPDVMRQSGARLVEVGTTNRTYARDYEGAITDETAALLAVHWSNFRIIGFTAQPTLSELAELAHRRGIVLIEDLGSGALADTAPFGLIHEPTVGESLAEGVDVVCFSGDKLMGGPQAGIIAGRADLVRKIAAHPLARAVRADKTALAGVATTLRHYLRSDHTEAIPIWRMISAQLPDLELRCRSWIEQIGIDDITLATSQSAVGGGSLPGETQESRAVVISDDALRRRGLTVDRVAERLRNGEPPLVPHVESGRLLIDARTVLPGQDAGVVAALRAALQPEPAST
ncbi:MAG TPA: L-seryl-tRNA(Sec) selenium transferase [Nitrolancea sp.]|nr:L-seryl-tRNA(Sec) selenium transferase [Nitrolancea sp.]